MSLKGEFKMLMKCVGLIISFLLSDVLVAQTLSTNFSLPNGINDNSTFFEIQNAMNDYWSSQNVKDGYKIENGIESKVPNWKLYKRWEYFWEQRVNLKTGEFPKTNSATEYSNGLNKLKKANTTESWTNLGTNSSLGGYAGIGRINCIAFHPTDNNIFWVGSPSGGIWKTTDGGTTWANLNDDQLVLGVSGIAVDYNNPDILYIATGDRDGGSMSSLSGGQAADNVSIGVLKSTDGGATWLSTGLTYTTSQSKLIYSLLIHPSNNQILFAATSDGIYKTTNGGTNWTRKSLNKWIDMEFKPGDPTVMYASSLPYVPTLVNRSTNSGENWFYINVGTSGIRGEIAVTPANPNDVYLLSANIIGGVYGVYKSTDSGASFSPANSGSPSGMLGYYSDGSGGNSGQGAYDWCIAVDPSDANTVFIGGVTTWKSTDGGTTFIANNNWTSSPIWNISGVPVVHADKHVLAYQNATTLFEGNDGGIYKTTDGGTSWNDLTNGMVISQIYRIGVSQTVINKTITGLQDNGSKLFNSGSWSDVTGGDGMECIVDYSNANYMYATYVYGQIKRSTNGATFATGYITANIPGGQPKGAWVTPYVLDPNNSATIIAAFDSVWKSTDRGDSWTGISQELSNSNKLRSLAISPSNSNVLYTADQTNMWKTTDGGATNWTSITLPATSNYLTYIAVKNNDPNTVWITFGGYTDGSKVYESTDGGSSWTNISTGLPNLPVMSIVQYKNVTSQNVLFVGTDIGVYLKEGSSDWASYSNGLPNVVVSELDIYYGTGTPKLRAGTFGRGLWETEISDPLPVELSSFTGTFTNDKVLLEWKTETEVNNYGFEIERKNNLESVDWEKIGFVNGNGNSNSPKYYSFEDTGINYGTHFYRLKQIDNDGHIDYSDQVEVFTGTNPFNYALSQNYPNPFNPVTIINYQIKEKGSVQLKVFNLLGEEVVTLVNEINNPGYYSVKLDAENLTSGVYLYSLKVNDFVQNRKMIIIK